MEGISEQEFLWITLGLLVCHFCALFGYSALRTRITEHGERIGKLEDLAAKPDPPPLNTAKAKSGLIHLQLGAQRLREAFDGERPEADEEDNDFAAFLDSGEQDDGL